MFMFICLFFCLLLCVVVEALAGIDTGFALVDLFLQQLADLVLGRAFLLRSRLHLVDVVGCFQTNDVQDLDDNNVRFLPDNILDSTLYGTGRWYLNGDELEIFTANDFIKYTGRFIKGQVSGKGRNQMSNEWNFKLIKKE